MIEMSGIQKAFNGNVVLKDVQFQLADGEIHALMGENGAGKSTMMKILTGIYERDNGVIKVDGEEVHFNSPKEAEAKGIAVIHQELNILPDLTVAENLFLGNEQTIGMGIMKNKEMNKEAQRILSQLGLDIDVRMPAGALSVGKQQIIEIAKAMETKANVIIMDEPTAALTDREIQTLFKTIRKLQSEGVSFVYISHRMEEIFAICDRITILRDGEYVGVRTIKDTTFDEIVQMMVGRELGERFPGRTAAIGDVKLEVKGLTRPGLCEDIHFSVRKGEIVALAGLMGAGRTEVAQAIFGYRKMTKGELFIDGNAVKINNPREAKKRGIGFVTEDRKTQGLVVDFSIKENIAMANFNKTSKSGIIRGSKEKSFVGKLVEKLGVKTPSAELPAK